MDKKGSVFFEEHTVGIIIGVLCLLILGYLGLKFYFFVDSETNLEKAEATLDKIVQKIDLLENGGGDNYLVYSFVSGEWSLVGWPNNLFDDPDVALQEYEGIDIPKTCGNNGWEKCLCFCESYVQDYKRAVLFHCDKTALCRDMSEFETFNVNNNGVILFDESKNILMSLKDGELKIDVEK